MSAAITTTRAPWTMAAIRWVFGVYFVAVGIVHFVIPEGLPAFMSWMYELSDSLHVVAGTAEILGGLGLILPRLVGVAPRLTSAAASGLAVLMVGAGVWHAGRGEWAQIFGNLVVAAVMAYVAVEEWRTQGR